MTARGGGKVVPRLVPLRALEEALQRYASERAYDNQTLGALRAALSAPHARDERGNLRHESLATQAAALFCEVVTHDRVPSPRPAIALDVVVDFVTRNNGTIDLSAEGDALQEILARLDR